MPSSDALVATVQNLGISQITRHLFLCTDQTKPKCCPKDEGLAVWNHLKQRLKDLGLDAPTPERPDCIFRTKANCLRVCAAGPILVVYPDGVWYREVTIPVLDRIIDEHLLQNKIVTEFVLCQHSLPTHELDSAS